MYQNLEKTIYRRKKSKQRRKKEKEMCVKDKGNARITLNIHFINSLYVYCIHNI